MTTKPEILDLSSILHFIGLLAGESIPDAKTIWNFKQLLEKDGR
jgi:IS5 family transposase